jgi:hypothetical protein
VIRVFAEQTNRSFFRGGGPYPSEFGQLADDLELREQKLPDEATWEEARTRADVIFGKPSPSFLSASNASLLRKELEEKAAEWRAPVSEMVRELRSWMGRLGMDTAGTARMQTAEAVLALVEELVAAKPEQALEALAKATIATTAEAMGNAGAQADKVVKALQRTPEPVFASLREIRDARQPAAEAILSGLRDALARDELAVPLDPALRTAMNQGLALLARSAGSEEKPAPKPRQPAQGWSVVEAGHREELDAESAEEVFRKIGEHLRQGKRRLRIEWTIEGQ